MAVTATAPDVVSSPAFVTIYDDEAPVVSLTVPAQLREGETPINNGTVTLDRAATVPLTLTLSADPANEIVMPSSITVPPGQTQAFFSIRAQDDNRIDGDLPVSLRTTAPGIAAASAQTTTIDNEQRNLSIALPPIITEGSTTSVAVAISGTLSAPLSVTITTSDSGQLTSPTVVTIPPGATTATFLLTAPDNSVRDGSRTALVTVNAPTFPQAAATITIRDNEIAGYRFTPLADLLDVSVPIGVTLSALDVEGNVITAPGGTANLELVLPDGTTRPVTPATVPLTGQHGWTGTLSLPQVSASPLRLRGSDASGNTGYSSLFDAMRVLPLRVNDIVWDKTRSRFYATVRTDDGSASAKSVVAIDPVTLQVTARVPTALEPGQLALSNGDDALYVTFRGDGSVAKLNPQSMTITSSFVVGTDPSSGTMYASDVFVVPGNSNAVVVSLSSMNSNTHTGVAAFDNGLMRPNRSSSSGNASQGIEPSADPTILFALNGQSSGYPLRKLRLDPNGVSEVATVPTVDPVYQNDIRSDGNLLITKAGVVMDGGAMRRVGAIGQTGLIVPELQANRAYVLEQTTFSSNSSDKIGSYDLTTLGSVRRLHLPFPVDYAGSFIRWGIDGLAFRSPAAVYILNSSQLIPSDPPADLSVTIQATPQPAAVGVPLTYAVRVSNAGPNPSRRTVLKATLSADQTFQTVSAQSGPGAATVVGSSITVAVGDLAAGESSTVTITTAPQSAGIVSCSATASGSSMDVAFANNVALAAVSVGFQPGAAMNQLRFAGNNLIYDPVRNLFWATIPTTVAAPFGGTVVSIDPVSGVVSAPVPLNGSPRNGCVALSRNGRYLYVGLGVAEVRRIDLQANPHTVTTIQLGADNFGYVGIARDIEVLDGDGTSFLVINSGRSAMVFEGTVRRRILTDRYQMDRLARTATPGVFVTYNTSDSGERMTKLTVTSSGITQQALPTGVLASYNYNDDITGSANLVLLSNGTLVNGPSLTINKSLGVSGRPCLDAQNGRAYLVSGTALRAFDIATGASTGALSLPTTSYGDWAQNCVRWGPDGFGVLGNDGKLYVFRWAAATPPEVDQNGDFISDNWAVSYFGTVTVDSSADSDRDGVPNALEYFFGTSPVASDATSIGTSVSTGISGSTMHLTFPRRPGLSPQAYRFETSLDLREWSAAQSVVETITPAGADGEMVNAAIPAPSPDTGFARVKWLGP